MPDTNFTKMNRFTKKLINNDWYFQKVNNHYYLRIYREDDMLEMIIEGKFKVFILKLIKKIF